MADETKNPRDLFLAALDQPPTERSAYLEAACAGDAALRRRVEALLAAHEQPGAFLSDANRTTTGDAAGTPSDNQTNVIVAGRYLLQEKIGEGGMGEVWIATQTDPVKRRVALKLIKAGMDTKAVLQRFEAERQALAMMEHPNIARVLDGGVTADRRPFFVMELVNGLPLTRFCDEAKLGIRERLELFAAICQAVQHSHQKGIIHRDLKPSNILVTVIDGRPVPKVIDFGVAKAVGGRLVDESLATQFGAVVGTLEYMAPEQAGYSGADIDTRADIYSLGVILYELLTGLRPIDARRLKQAAYTEMIRIIQSDEPSKPSTRLSTDESLSSLAASRHIEPKKLMALLRGELDWVVMKCLEKQRERRYETANGLARDIRRYLADEPVEARPPSFGYRFGKFLRRNRGPVLAASLMFLVLLAGIASTTWGMVRAAQRAEGERLAKQEALDEKAKALAAAAAEKDARTQAQKRLAQMEKGNEIINSIFTDLDIRKVKAEGEPLEAVLADRLVKAAGVLEGEAVGDALVVAGLQERLGASLLSLGRPLGAIPLFVKARATRTSQQGGDHPDTLKSMVNLGAAYRAAGQHDLALPLQEETLKLMKATLGADHLDTLASMNNLASVYWATQKADQAVALYEETLKLRTVKLGGDHSDTLTSMNNLATCYWSLGKRDLALPLFEDNWKLLKATLGADHPNTIGSMNNLAATYEAAGRQNRSLPLYEEALKLTKARLGAEHPDTLLSMNNLGAGYLAAKKLDLALPLFQDAAAGIEKRRFQHEYAPRIVNNLILCLERLGQFARAETWRRKWLAVIKERSGAASLAYAEELRELSANLLAQKRMADAEVLLREGLAIREKVQPDDWMTFSTQITLGGTLLAQKKYAAAEPLLLAGYEGMVQREKTIPSKDVRRISHGIQFLVHLYEATGKTDDAAKWQEVLNARDKR